MIVVNPEFHRHLWLNFSTFRLAAMPLLLAMIFYVFSDEDMVWQASLLMPALFMYGIIVILWGNYEAATATARDVGSNTWDFQKMSAISPWQLTIGKLFGATSYVWYAGLMLLAIIALSYGYTEEYRDFAKLHKIHSSPVRPIIYLIFAAVMGHATALLLGLESLRRRGKSSTALSFIMGFLTSLFIISLTIGDDLDGGRNKFGRSLELDWNGWTVDKHQFIIGSLIFFFCWILIGIHRSYRSELQYKNGPSAIVAFLVTVCVYATGLLDNIPNAAPDYDAKILAVKMMLCFTIIGPCCYIALFMEAGNFSKYARWFYAIKDKEWKRVYENTPAWVGVLVLLIPVYIAVNISFASVSDYNGKIMGRHIFSVFAFTSASLLFMLRDGLVIHTLLSGIIEKHKFFALVLFYLVAYVLLPFIVLSGINKSNIVPYMQASLYFYPWGGKSFWSGCGPVLVQTLIAGVIFKYTMNKLRIKA